MQYVLFISVIVANLILGGIVLARKSNKVSGWLFGVAILSICIWAAGDMLLLGARDEGWARVGAYLFYVAPMTVPVTLWLFSLIFPEDSRLSKRSVIFGVVSFSVVAGMIFYDLDWLLASIAITDHLNIVTPKVPGFYFYAFYLSFFFTLTYMSLLNKQIKARGIARLQLTYTMLGALLASIPALITNLILPLVGIKHLIWVGPVFSLLSVYCVMVAMIKHRMFDIRLLVARSLAYVLTLVVLASVYGVIVFLAIAYIFDLDISLSARIFISAATALVAITFPSIKTFFDKATNTIFYRDSYEPQEFIRQLNGVVVSTVQIKPLLLQSVEVIEQNLKCEFCIFGLKETRYVPQRTIGTKQIEFTKDEVNSVRALTVSHADPLIVTDEIVESDPELFSILHKHNIEILARLTTSHEVGIEGLGYILIGAKKSGNPYTSQDMRIIAIVANELVIAIQNAMRFEEIERFNETLEQKVKTATNKLQKTNEKLVQMDANKDEFISMASHQLRTPLTSMKGYVSMVLEEDAGPLNKQQKQMLGQAFVSSQRMAFLIADLLNISRLRTGKFVIERSKVSLPNVIKEEVDQLHDTAVARGLKLQFEKPRDFPLLMLDEMKTRQVIMNFIDNAIYYTKSGGTITVQLIQTDKSIEFKVTDTGIGVPRHEQQHLFTKYFRAGNARQARPDGTGLGLFMAQKVVVAQGGAISFRSSEGKGSTFGFIFPKAKLTVPDEIPIENVPKSLSIYDKVRS